MLLKHVRKGQTLCWRCQRLFHRFYGRLQLSL